MLIATFGPTTSWEGLKITWEDERFLLEGHGHVTAADVMEYDRQGHLVWESAGTRAWVGSRVGARVAAPQAAGPLASVASRLASWSSALRQRVARALRAHAEDSPRMARAKRTFLIAIAVLVVANAVLLLGLLGAIHMP